MVPLISQHTTSSRFELVWYSLSLNEVTRDQESAAKAKERNLSLPIWNALDVACIDQNTAAIASPTGKFIQLVDLNTGKTVKCINTNTTCSSITSTNGMLVFCAFGKGLRKVDLKDENIVEIVAFAADSWSRVTSFDDRPYHTNSKRDEVVCCDINGTILWTFTDKSV
jgi:outer membrane protein assembly factor BamB